MSSSNADSPQGAKPRFSIALGAILLVIGTAGLMFVLQAVFGRAISLTVDRGPTPGTLHLSWNPVRGVTSYRVEESGKNVPYGHDTVGKTSKTEWDVTGLATGVQYSFKIAAEDAQGNYVKSTWVDATP